MNNCNPETESIQYRESPYLDALETLKAKIDQQTVIDLMAQILEYSDRNLYFEDLVIYGDRADNFGIQDGQKRILFSSTPVGVLTNKITEAYMHRLEQLLQGLVHFQSVTENFNQEQRSELLSPIKTIAELNEYSPNIHAPLSEQEIIDIAMETLELNGEDIDLSNFSVYSERLGYLKISTPFLGFSVIEGVVALNRMQLSDMERLKGLVCELGLSE